MCPEGLIKTEDLPDKWGLLYWLGGKQTACIKNPELQISDTMQEMNIAASRLRREGIGSKIFNYKKYSKIL
jgi:hypothetical protein